MKTKEEEIQKSDSGSPSIQYCLNCGTKLSDNYCPHCGQKKQNQRQTLRELVADFISSFTSFESKFFQTLKFLLFRPGFLPLEYIKGKRERYYHPVRAYVFFSFLFFLAFLSLPDKNNINIHIGDWNISNEKDSINHAPKYSSVTQYDSIQKHLAPEMQDGWISHLLNRKEIKIKTRYKDKGSEFVSIFYKVLLSNFPKIFFLLLPVFALLLKILYMRRGFYYSEHLVFSIYFYDFWFLEGFFSMLINLVPALGWARIALFLWVMVYLLLAMKKMYNQRWGKTFLKYFLLCSIFFVCFIVAFLLDIFITFIFI